MEPLTHPVTAYLVFQYDKNLYPALLAQLATDALTAQNCAPMSAPLITQATATLITAEAAVTLTLEAPGAVTLSDLPDGTRATVGLLVGLSMAPHANGPAQDRDALLSRLAGLLHHLASHLSPDFIDWCGAAVLVPTPDFLNAIEPVRPRRPSRPARSTRADARAWRKSAANLDQPLHDPKTGEPETQNLHLYRTEQELRCAMTAEIGADELARARAEHGAPEALPVEARLTGWALSIAVGTVSLPVAASLAVINVAKGEDVRVAGLAMGVMGLFTSLSAMGVEFDLFAGLI